MPFANKQTAREYQAERKRAERRQERVVRIPKCRSRKRRNRLEKDDIEWLMFYFSKHCGLPDPFTYVFTEQQIEMIRAFGAAIRQGGDQAIAASRGEGKTTIVERLITKYTLQGTLSYSVLFQSTGALADNSLDTIKTSMVDNELLLAYYPEVCVPVQSLENTPHRAPYQLVSGFRFDDGKSYEMAASHFTWSGQEVIFPNVPGSPSAGSIIATRGLDSAVRGLKKRGRRPQLAVIDDPDTEETARSEEQSKKLEDRIDKTIGGLGSQKKPIARILLSTIQSKVSVSYTFTDPKKKPSWKPKRFKFLVTPPERADLWDDFVMLKQSDWVEGTNQARKYYRKNRKKMDAGAVVANPERLDRSNGELSALEHFYTLVARLGAEAVNTEYNNDPPDELGPVESGIYATLIQRRLSGYPRRVVPPSCTTLTQGIDVQKLGVYWVIKAWQPDATNYILDYGFYETQGTVYGSDEGVELAIRSAILGRFEQQKEFPCMTVDGEIVDLDLTLIDSGWQSPAVYRACVESGLGCYPAKGHGKSQGCAVTNFHDLWKRTPDRRPGDGWFMSKLPKGFWLVHCDTDRWKSFEHARWLTTEGKPGAAYLFGEMTDKERKFLGKYLPKESKEHISYAKHLTSEVEAEELIRGSLKRVWKTKAGRGQNHYFDASYLASVAASMKGISLLGSGKPAGAAKRRSLADMAKGK